jgi:hypothetical protein
LDPLQINPLAVQILLLLAAAILLAGSFPGMPIFRALTSVSERGARRLTVVFAIALPLGVMMIGAGLVLDSFRIYAVEQDSSSLWRLVFDTGFLVIQGVSLAVNLATLFGSRKPGAQRSGA